jgi:3-dehydroquinate dehydratase-1
MENKIAVVLWGIEKEKNVNKIVNDVKWIEIRIDKFLKVFPEEKLIPYLKQIRKKFKYNIIGTIRCSREQDSDRIYIEETKRKYLYEKILPYIDYIDIEIKSKISSEIIKISKDRNKKVILSYHNFKKIPPLKNLKKIYQQANLLNPDIFKIALQINKKSEFLYLMNAFLKWKKTVLFVPMGLPGIFRLIPLYYGSPFTYVFCEKQSAPGQFSYDDFKKFPI